MQGQAGRAGFGGDHEIEQHDDADLQGQGYPEHLGAEVDVAVTEQRDDRQYRERVDGPGYLRAAVETHGVVDRPPDVAVDPHLDGGVGDEGDNRDPLTHAPPEPEGHIGEERAGLGYVRCHRHEADAEDQQHERGDQEAHRCPGAVAQAHGERHVAADHGQRCGRGDDHEDDAERAEPTREVWLGRRRVR